MRSVILLSGVLGISGLFAGSARGAINTWNGTGKWTSDASNWSDGASPTPAHVSPGSPTGTSDTLEVASGTVEYDPSQSGDYRLNETLTIDSGATFFQTIGSGAWMKIGNASNATLNVYGTFNSLMGSGGNFFAGNGAKGDINVIGGSINTSADVVVQNASTVTATGATGSIISTSTLQLNNGTVVSSGGASMQFNGVNFNNGGTTLSADGGSISFHNLGAFKGTISVTNGGTISQSVGSLVANAGTTISVSGAGSSLNLTDPNEHNGELHPNGGSVSVSAGTVNVQLISFDGGEGTLEFSGGQINISRGDYFRGIYSVGGARYVDYTGAEKGVMFFKNGAVADMIGLINDGTIRINTAVVDSTSFEVYNADGGVYVLVPEPTSLGTVGLLGLIGLRRRRRAILAA